MTEVRRYEMTPSQRCGEAWQDLEPQSDGDWVTYEDYDALAARVQAVEREAGENKRACSQAQDDREAMRQQLAEAQGTIVRKDEALEINRQAHGIVRDQLTQADQQVTRLREALQHINYSRSQWIIGKITNDEYFNCIADGLREGEV